jgi:hypothetical protein
MKSGCWELEDAEGEKMKAVQLLAPHGAIKSGELIESHPVGQPENLGY